VIRQTSFQFDIQERNAMPVATAPNPVDSANGPAASARTRKPRRDKRVDANGNVMRRMVLLVSRQDETIILQRVADHVGDRFVKELIFGDVDKEEFIGTAIAEILAKES
jgi:hypothetical protein